MSGRRAKRQRREAQEVMNLLGPIIELVPEAMIELEGDDEAVQEWLTIAVALHHFKPDLNLEDLLPSRIQKTFELHGKAMLEDAEKTERQIEHTP